MAFRIQEDTQTNLVEKEFQAKVAARDKGRLHQFDLDYRNSLINKVCFLLDYVADEDLTIITTKIISRRYELYESAQGRNAGRNYFRELVNTSDTEALEGLLLDDLKPVLERRARASYKTAAAYKHVYYGVPMPTATNAIQEAYNAFGGIFADALDQEAQRQFNAAVDADPDHLLEHHEWQKCGDFKDLFRTYIPRLSLYRQREFARIIREKIDPSLPLNSKHALLRHFVIRLSDALYLEGLHKEANELARQVTGRIYVAERERHSNNKQLTKKPLLRLNAAVLVDFMQRLLRIIAQDNAPTAISKQPPQYQVISAKQPPPPMEEKKSDMLLLHNLSKRMLDLQAKDDRAFAGSGFDQQRPITSAFDAKNKSPYALNIYGPPRPKL